jgi:hypothetical protein
LQAGHPLNEGVGRICNYALARFGQSQQPVPLVIFAAFIGDWLLPHNLFDLVINLKTAKARGLDVPSSIGPRADEVTE